MDSTLRLSAYNLSRREALARFIAAHQVEGGGFVEALDIIEPDLLGTYHAIASLNYIDKLDVIDRDAAIEFIMSHYNGSIFTMFPHTRNVWMISVVDALEALSILGALDRVNSDAIVDWVMGMQDKETGLFYSNYVDGEKQNLALMDGTYAAVLILKMFNRLDLIDREKVIRSFYRYFFMHDVDRFVDIFGSPVENWFGVVTMKVLGGLNGSIKDIIAKSLLREIDPKTGMSTHSENAEGTAVIIYTLYLLDRLDWFPNLDGALDGLLSLQSHYDGGFRAAPDSTDSSAGLIVSWRVCQALKILNATDRLDEPFQTEIIPTYTGSWGKENNTSNNSDGDSSLNPSLPISYPNFDSNNDNGDWTMLYLVLILSSIIIVMVSIQRSIGFISKKLRKKKKHRVSIYYVGVKKRKRRR